MIRPRSLAVLLAVALSCTATTAKANSLVNGSFETGNYSPIINTSYVIVSPGATNITGWTVGGAGVDWHQNSFEIQNAFDGTKMVDLNLQGGGLSDTGTLSQSFATTPGASYTLTFYLAGPNTSFPDPRQVRVDIAGIDQIFSQAASNNLALVWGKETLPFAANAATTTLMFSSVNGSGFWGPFLDNVSVDPSAVPEPSSLVLGCLAIVSLGLFVCTRHRLRRCAA
jgi:choice-of-anchor C domain-containing protein